MHDHECRECGEKFICGESFDECFANSIVCSSCFWRVEAWRYGFVFLLLIAAIGLTIEFFWLLYKF